MSNSKGRWIGTAAGPAAVAFGAGELRFVPLSTERGLGGPLGAGRVPAAVVPCGHSLADPSSSGPY